MELLDSEKALLRAGAHPPEKVITYPNLLRGNHRVLVDEKRMQQNGMILTFCIR